MEILTTVGITKESYPKLYYCLFGISIDNNMDLLQEYSVLYSWIRLLPIFENQLTQLNSDELDTLICGEESDAFDIVDRYNLHEVHEFLNLFFDGML